MTYTYRPDDNELVGNRLMEVSEVQEGTHGDLPPALVTDVDEMMAEGRGIAKLEEMKSAIEAAIEANRDD
jgi:hypothetical protein